MRERGRGVSFFFLSRKKPPSVPKSVVGFLFVCFCFRPPRKKKFVKLFLDLVSSQKGRKDKKKQRRKRKETKHRQQNKRQTRPKRREKKAETKKPNRNKIEIKNAKRVVF